MARTASGFHRLAGEAFGAFHEAMRVMMVDVDLVALAHSYVGESLRGSRRIGNLIESSNAVVGEIG